MWTLLQIELHKIFRRPRTYIAFAAIILLIGIIQFGLKVDGKGYMDFMMHDLKDSLDITGVLLNGYFVCYVILQLLLVHVPLLISLIAADMISGEANMGTLRFLLTKPVSRTQFILAKFLAATIYTLLLLTVMAFLALFVSMWIFGTDDMLLRKTNYIVILQHNDVFWRYAGAFGFAAVAMTTVAALGFLLSVFAENSIGPIVTTMSIIVVLTILSTMSIPIFELIKPFLFTTYMNNWKEFFDERVNDNNVAIIGSIQNPERIITSLLVLAAHIVVFVGAAILVFRRKDILS